MKHTLNLLRRFPVYTLSNYSLMATIRPMPKWTRTRRTRSATGAGLSRHSKSTSNLNRTFQSCWYIVVFDDRNKFLINCLLRRLLIWFLCHRISGYYLLWNCMTPEIQDFIGEFMRNRLWSLLEKFLHPSVRSYKGKMRENPVGKWLKLKDKSACFRRSLWSVARAQGRAISEWPSRSSSTEKSSVLIPCSSTRVILIFDLKDWFLPLLYIRISSL